LTQYGVFLPREWIMTKDDIFKKVREVLVDALGVDEEEVIPTATLVGDLGAESIDFLDIRFRLEKAFTADLATPLKIPNDELFPEDLQPLLNDPRYVADGKVTSDGIAELKRRMPYCDLTDFEKNPLVDKAPLLMTVDTVTKYMAAKLGVAA
jgi:acyl carrier protein